MPEIEEIFGTDADAPLIEDDDDDEQDSAPAPQYRANTSSNERKALAPRKNTRNNFACPWMNCRAPLDLR